MAYLAAVGIESTLWKFLIDQKIKSAGIYKIEIDKKPTTMKKITHKQNRDMHTDVVVWVTTSTGKIEKRLHGIFANGVNKDGGDDICILHCRLFAEDRVLNAKDSIGDWLADGLLPQDIVTSLEEGFSAMEELTNSPVIDGNDENCAKANNAIQNMRMPESFFQGMEALRIVSLYHTGISSPPSSLFQLRDLSVLILRGCRRVEELPTLIGGLKKLELLDLSCTLIKNLPKEIGELINLKKLGLRMLSLHTIPVEISKLGSLVELDTYKTFIRWDGSEGSELLVPNCDASLNHIINLASLTSLKVMVQKFECINGEIIRQLRRLTRFHLIVARIPRHLRELPEESYNKMLVIMHCDCSSLDEYSILNDLDCLIINSCGKLSTISSLLGVQTGLRDLRIEFCPELKVTKARADDKSLLNLETLKLVSLPLLEDELVLGKDLIDVQIIRCPKLKNLQTSLCKMNKVKELFIGDLEGIEELDETHMMQLEKLKIFCIPQLRRVGVPKNIEVLNIWRCLELKIFASRFFNFEKLTELSISDVCELEKLVDGEVDNPATGLTKLRKLNLRRLHSFVSIWKGKLEIGCFGNLETLEFSMCPRLRNLLPSGYGRLEKLKEVHASYCDELENILDPEVEVEGHALQSLEKMHLTQLPRLSSIFPVKSGLILENLAVLYLSNCPTLKVVIPYSFQGLQMLKHIYVGECDSLEYIIGGEGVMENALPNLGKIFAVNLLNLKAIWQGELGDGSLKSLNYLEVTKCPVLKCLFPSNSHKLEKLEIVHVKDSDGLENIVGKGPAEGFALPGLYFLYLSNLGGIKRLWGKGMEDGALRNLQRLTIINCKKLETLWDGEIGVGVLGSLKTVSVSSCPELKDLLASNLQGLDKLEEVWIKDCGVELITGELLVENSLQSLKKIQLHCLPRLKFMWEEGDQGTVALSGLKMLSIGNCSSLKVLPSGLLESPNLESLAVHGCGIMEKIIGDKHENALPGLVSLYLENLQNLKVISEKVMGAGCLDNLERLTVKGIRGLRSLPPDLCRLQKLKNLSVGQCDEMESLLEQWEENAMTNLEYLDIEDLPKLKMMWSGVSRVQSLKNLKRVYVKGCQRLKNMPYGLLKLEKLEQLHVTNCDEIETLFRKEAEEVAILLSLIVVKLKAMPRLTEVWEGIVQLPQLKYLTVTECPQLTKLSFELDPSIIASITGSKDWWDTLEIEAEIRSELQKSFKPWPTEGITSNSRSFFPRWRGRRHSAVARCFPTNFGHSE